MKKITPIIIIISLISSKLANSQTISFDSSLQLLTNALTAKLRSLKDEKIAVWDLTDLNGNVSPIGKYIAEDVSINLSDKFHIVNRNQLNTILKENQLTSEGFLDQTTMKQLKKLAQVDIIVTGSVSVLANNIKITLQALDSLADILAATKGDVSMNDDIKDLLGINIGSNNKGFNSPLNSNEHLNNPATVSSDCQNNNTGDFCFNNTTSNNLTLHLKSGSPLWYDGDLTLSSGQTQCFYSLKGGVYQFIIYRRGDGVSYLLKQGEIKVETCQSKTFTIN